MFATISVPRGTPAAAATDALHILVRQARAGHAADACGAEIVLFGLDAA